MKSILSGSCAVVLFIFASDGFSQSTLTNGLTAFYPFNGNARDVSGNAYDGVVYGATLTEDRFGRANNAYRFDGVSSYIRTDKVLPDMQSASVSCWIRYPVYPVEGYVFMDGDSRPGSDFFLTTGYENSIWSVVKDNSVVGYPLPAVTDTWLHVAVVADNNGQSNVLKMWLNGQLVSSSSTDGNANVGNHAQLYIGCLAVSGGLNFRGDIDDFRIYGRALTDSEVEEIYRSESSTPPIVPPRVVSTSGKVWGDWGATWVEYLNDEPDVSSLVEHDATGSFRHSTVSPQGLTINESSRESSQESWNTASASVSPFQVSMHSSSGPGGSYIKIFSESKTVLKFDSNVISLVVSAWHDWNYFDDEQDLFMELRDIENADLLLRVTIHDFWEYLDASWVVPVVPERQYQLTLSGRIESWDFKYVDMWMDVDITEGCQPPPAPSSISAGSDGSCQGIVFAYCDPVIYATSYELCRDGVVVQQSQFPDFVDYPGDTLPHAYSIRGVNSCSTGAESNPVSVIAGGPPPPPNAPEVVGTCDGIAISFAPVAAAAEYEVYRDGAYVMSINAADPLEFRDYPSDMAPHSYSLIAVNNCGPSAEGPAVMGSAKVVPLPPALTATDGLLEGKVLLSWNSVPGASYYSILRDGVVIQDMTEALSYEDNLAGQAQHTYTVVAVGECGSAGTSDTGYPIIQGVDTSWVTAFNGPTLRTDVPGWRGARLKVGPQDITVRQLGRVFLNGNVLNHELRVVRVSDKVVVATAVWQPAGGVHGEILYVRIAPVTLVANTEYYLVSQEFTGESVYSYNTVVTTTDAATVLSAIYSTTWTRWYVPTSSTGSYSYGPVSIMYEGCKPPPAPGWLTAEDGLACGKVRVSWGQVTGATGYEVYRDGVSIGQSPGGETTFEDPVGPEVAHTYTVRSVNNCGNGPESTADTGFSVGGPPPPVNVSTMEGSACGKVLVTWSPVAEAYGYSIYRDDTLVAEFITGTFFEDEPGDANPHEYRVSAWGNCGEGRISAEVFGSAEACVDCTETPWTTAFTARTLRTDVPGWRGTRLMVGSTDIRVSHLGRIYLSGNVMNHELRLVRVSDKAVVGSVVWSPAGSTDGQISYVPLGSPVTLTANTEYYLVSQEYAGETVYSYNTVVSVTEAAAVLSAVYSTSWTRWYVPSSSTGSYSYGPVSFIYCSTAPGAN